MAARRSVFQRVVWTAAFVWVSLLAGLWLLTDRTIHQSQSQAARQAVDVDLAGLVDIYASGGQNELVARVMDRMALQPSDGSRAHYLLLDAGGRRLAGDVPRWPALDPRMSEAGRVRLGAHTSAYARATQLSPDLRLLVARTLPPRNPLTRQIALVFGFSGSAVTILIFVIGSRAARRLQGRIARISDSLDQGETTALEGSPNPAAPDEIDALAAHSRRALARERQLVSAYQAVSDQLAHEVRTPLMHLDTRLNRLLAQQPAPEARTELLGAKDDLRRLVAMATSLLDIAANEASAGDPRGLKPVDLTALVSGLCDLYGDSAEELGRVFEWSAAPGITIAGDEAQLGQLVVNLLDNAFKYVPDGGTVRLTLAHGPVLTVEDDGPGVPVADAERIFERFYRSTAAATGTSGSGLGLALARAIAGRHGLTLRLEPSDKGACFVVRSAQS